MFSCFITIIFFIGVTWASSFNDSSNFWDLKTQVESASNCRISVRGPFDEFGFESSVPSRMWQDIPGNWHYDLMAELPAEFELGMCDQNMNGSHVLMRTFSDVDNDTHMGFLLPTLSPNNIIYITKFPAPPNLAYRISTGGAYRQYGLTAVGSRRNQVVVYLLLSTIPILTGFASSWIYWYVYCSIKVCKFGRVQNLSLLPITNRSEIRPDHWLSDSTSRLSKHLTPQSDVTTGWHRQTVLIATLEYEIDDWDIKISVGGLGFMTHLMSKYLKDLSLVWVIPCVQDLEYPCDQKAEPINITISGVDYIVQVQYHVVQNITYVLLDAPIFRAQTVAEPYPLGAGDIRSAIYYSAWYVFFII